MLFLLLAPLKTRSLLDVLFAVALQMFGYLPRCTPSTSLVIAKSLTANAKSKDPSTDYGRPLKALHKGSSQVDMGVPSTSSLDIALLSQLGSRNSSTFTRIIRCQTCQRVLVPIRVALEEIHDGRIGVPMHRAYLQRARQLRSQDPRGIQDTFERHALISA